MINFLAQSEMEPSKGFLNYEINYHYYLGPYLREREKTDGHLVLSFLSLFLLLLLLLLSDRNGGERVSGTVQKRWNWFHGLQSN